MCGKILQSGDDQSLKECGHIIEEYGTLIQYYAQQTQRYAQSSLDSQDDAHSLYLYEQAVEAHVNAARVHIEAVNAYTHEVEKVLKTIDLHRERL